MVEEKAAAQRNDLVELLVDLFTNMSVMVKEELQVGNKEVELLEKMNLRVAEEYNFFGDVASGLKVFVEQLKEKNGSFNQYTQQIDTIDQQVREFEAIVSMLVKYVSLLESKVQLAFSNLTS